MSNTKDGERSRLWGSPKAIWLAVVAFIPVAALVVDTLSCQINQSRLALDREKLEIDRRNRREDRALAQPRLDIPTPHESKYRPLEPIIPAGPNFYTPIGFRNPGASECYITEVQLTDGEWIDTPPRQMLYGASPPVDVVFEERHWVPDKRRFVLKLTKPATVAPGEWRELHLWIVNKAWVGKTFSGNVTVVHNGGTGFEVQNVQIDVIPDNGPVRNGA